LFSLIVGQGFGSEGLGATTVRQVVREDLSAAKAKEPNKRSAIRKKPTTSAMAPPNPILITHPCSGPGTTSPAGEATQGPSLVDYNLELEADFPMDMVLEMQENATKKTRKTVIGRTLGGRATFKALHECLKLHLPASFISATLLARGYFKILFENEEGAITTRKLTTVEWNGLNLSFSRYTPNFDVSFQGAEALFTDTIKIQFFNLHEQFCNTRALTIMASKFGEVLEIEATDSYMKRPAGPMVTIEVRDITKLAGYIKILSMAEGALAKDIVFQRIIYSGLLNQCRKCPRFGHHAQICNLNKTKPREGLTHHNNNPPRPSEKAERALDSRAPHQSATRASKTGPSLKAQTIPQAKGNGIGAIPSPKLAPSWG